MGIRPYQIVKKGEVTYTFNSIGTKGTIKKLVQFSATSQNDIFNVGFGDIQSNGEIDDKSESNNGDITKVLVTIISIIFDYTNSHKDLKIVFTGSNSQRTFLYQRLLSRYYSIYSIAHLTSLPVHPTDKPELFFYLPEFFPSFPVHPTDNPELFFYLPEFFPSLPLHPTDNPELFFCLPEFFPSLPVHPTDNPELFFCLPEFFPSLPEFFPGLPVHPTDNTA